MDGKVNGPTTQPYTKVNGTSDFAFPSIGDVIKDGSSVKVSVLENFSRPKANSTVIKV